MIEPNTMVIITDANGDTHEVEALSGVERGRDMPIVWVNLPRKSGDFEQLAVTQAAFNHAARNLAEWVEQARAAFQALAQRVAAEWERIVTALRQLLGFLPQPGSLVRHDQNHKVAEVLELSGMVLIVRRPGRPRPERWPLARVTPVRPQ